MRYLILSDIHANREALEAVLGDADGRYDRVVCCGDVVGYGADPNAAAEWARQHVPVIIRGNHDKVCTGLASSEWFNPTAQESARWTERELTPGNLEYLRALAPGPLRVEDFHILHGSPLDEDEYLLSTGDVSAAAANLDPGVHFFGHTHWQGGFAIYRHVVRGIGKPGPEEPERTLELELESGLIYLLNPGSVGQPRDGDPRAAYAIYQARERRVVYRRVEYDVAAAQASIRGAGLPPSLANRLAAGR